MDKSAWHRNSYLLWITMRSSGKRPWVLSCVAFRLSASEAHATVRLESNARSGPERGPLCCCSGCRRTRQKWCDFGWLGKVAVVWEASGMARRG